MEYGATADASATLHAILYRHKTGRVFLPPLHPYIPLDVQYGEQKSLQKKTDSWLEMARDLAAEMHHSGLKNTVLLPPEVTDARPWTWLGFNVGVKYTLYIDFPLDERRLSHSIVRNYRRAKREGYRCERTDNVQHALTCVEDTASRKGFRHMLTVQDWQLLQELLGDQLRVYVTYQANGEPASAIVCLLPPLNGRVLYWVGGTRRENLRDGASLFTYYRSLKDLESNGYVGADLVGANIPSVARMKAGLGAHLVPFYSLEDYSSRNFVRYVREWWRYGHRNLSQKT